MQWIGAPLAQSSVFGIEHIQPPIESPVIVPTDPRQQNLQELPKPLTVSDMPTRFGVFLHGGCSLMIQSIRTTSVLLKNLDAFEGWMSRTYARLTNWVQRAAGGRTCQLLLEMAPADVQGLYWALVPSTQIMVYLED